MAIIMLKNVPLAFPAIAAPQAFADGEPAYGAKFPIKPGSEHEALIEAAMATVAKEKWKDEAEAILADLISDGKVCFAKKEYKSKKTRQPYSGFEGQFYLSARNAKLQPTAMDKFGNKLVTAGDIERTLYSGAIVHASVEIWAQDNSYGQRINCNLRGVMWADEGTNFAGASAASADEFAGFAADPADSLV